MESASLKGLDSLLSTVQMPGGVPVGTLGIGKPGATNAALLAVAILAAGDASLRRNSGGSVSTRRKRSGRRLSPERFERKGSMKKLVPLTALAVLASVAAFAAAIPRR